MGALLVLQTVAIVLLALLVGGLLRTHAEILRSLHRLGAGVGDVAAQLPHPVEIGRPREPTPVASATSAVDIVGVTPGGEAVKVGVRTTRQSTLLAFLSSTCATCEGFFRDLREPEGLRLVIVTKGPPDEDSARIAALAPPDALVVMSTQAWQDYGVPVTPYFMLVDGRTGAIAGQGSGASWDQVSSLLRQATGDDEEAEIDRQLLAAGIRPGDPRLYPTEREPRARP